MASSISVSSNVVTAILVLSVTIIVSTFLCLLIRYFIRRCRSFSSAEDFAVAAVAAVAIASSSARSFSSSASRVSPQFNDSVRIDSLPIFTFASLTTKKKRHSSSEIINADCAVCLSKFEPRDELRLLPICCHAFHAECVDTWLQSNQTKTCPLCRSMIFLTDDEILSKVLTASSALADGTRNGSFRVEIGNVIRHSRNGSVVSSDLGASHRSSTYSIGSFDYVVHVESEVPTTHTRAVSQDKDDSTDTAGAVVARGNISAEVGGVSRGWLREYVYRLSSRTISFRSSGRFFGGDRLNDFVIGWNYDVEANRAGEEISEMFRWLSGV